MEEKKIIGIITAFILVITASFLNSKNLSKSQKNILFILMIFPPAQWVTGIIFLNLHKKKLKTSQIASEKKTDENPMKSKSSNENNSLIKIKEKTITTQEIYNKKEELLKKSLEMNLISKTEFESKVKNIENEKKITENQVRDAEKEIVNSEKFEKSKKTLKKLYDNNIITKEEFNLKIQEQKKIVYGVEKDTLLNVKPSPESKNKTIEKNIIIFFSIGLVIILASLILSNLPEHTKIESDIYYENQIQFFLTAETQENFLEVIEYFDLNNVSRCWNLSNPSYDELSSRYQKQWKETSHTALSINFINNKQTRVFEANIDYQFYNEEEKEWKDRNRTIRFVFGQNNKIIEVYEIK
mgnify:CR=1 FL=1